MKNTIIILKYDFVEYIFYTNHTYNLDQDLKIKIGRARQVHKISKRILRYKIDSWSIQAQVEGCVPFDVQKLGVKD